VFPLKDNIPTEHFPVVTVLLIAANVFVYFFLQDGLLGLPDGGTGGDWPVTQYAFIPCELTGDTPCETAPGGPTDWVTVFTAMFMHGSILHLGGNMLFLWIFGNNVEDSMGRLRYLLFYLLAGYAATALQTFVTLETSPNSAAIPNLGASGAISGVLGAYLLILPHAKVLTAIVLGFIFFLREIPALFFLGVYFLFQLWQAGGQWTNPPEGGGVAVFAHLGGFVFGLLAVTLFRKRAPLRPTH
jgi:membrane associated rhomboid family serine protease